VVLSRVDLEARKLSMAIGGSVKFALEELGADALQIPWLQSSSQMTDSVPHLLELVYIKNVRAWGGAALPLTPARPPGRCCR
jgi:hypothetical protein